MKIVTTFAAAAVAACMFAAPSLAYDFVADYIDCYGLDDAKPVYNSVSYGTVWAGRYNWTVTSTDGLAGNPFKQGQNFFTFCVELQDLADPTAFKTALPENVPDPGTPVGPMGEGKAKALSSLYEQHFSTAAKGTTTEAAAFSLCVWEIVYETIDYSAIADGGKVAGLSVGDGLFTCTSASAGKADEWLGNIFKRSTILGGLIGLTSETAQDQMYFFVPLPAPIALAGVGLLGVIFGRKRLQSIVS